MVVSAEDIGELLSGYELRFRGRDVEIKKIISRNHQSQKHVVGFDDILVSIYASGSAYSNSEVRGFLIF